MIFIDKMKNLKIYKTSIFLPTVENDKKRKSAILLMTPNYDSSKKLMEHPLFVNRLRYSSYYIKRDISYYINSKKLEEVEENYIGTYNSNIIPSEYVLEMTAAERNKLSDDQFGLPEERKYPLDTPEHVKSAIKFFNYCPKEKEETLAKNIIKAIHKFKIEDEINYSKNNRFFKYYKILQKESVETNTALKYIPETVINTGDKLLFFNEDVNDQQLRKMLYLDRIRTRKDLVLLYDMVKKDLPFIKFAYPDLDRYAGKNIFEDLYYYNKLFFENNKWVLQKGLNLYLIFMNRLLNDPELKSAGYEKKTIMIPITDWSNDPMIWNFRYSLNPMSIIYQLMFTNNTGKLKSVFGNTNILFVAKDKYFKINFSEIEDKDITRMANRFKLFLIKIVKNEEFDYEDIDTTADNVDSSEVIKANIIDKIELSKGIDLTSKVAMAKSLEKDNLKVINNKKVEKKTPVEDTDKVISKGTEVNVDNKQDKLEDKINYLAKSIDKAADNADTEDQALEDLDNEEIKQILFDLDALDTDKPDISENRAGRISALDTALLDTEVNGRSIKDILEPVEKKEIPKMKLDTLSTPNEEWKELTYTNFDKDYDIDKDVIRCFRHLSTTSRPIAIRKLDVTNNSTSEDRVNLYTVEMEDYKGKRFTIRLDIPIMVDNRFLLRGNYKAVQTQFFNMPIIKTDDDTCQIISNYMKIFVRRFGSTGGKSMPLTGRFIKAAKKYKGRKIKIDNGDNHKICNKYELPIDYIDLASNLNKITTDEFIIFFNQDEIREKYNVNNSLGIPFGYDLKEKQILYYSPNPKLTFTHELLKLFANYSDFTDLVYSASKPSVCMYSRCSIMNSQIPLVIICGYHEGLRKTLDKAKIEYKLEKSLSKEDRYNDELDWIRFKDGYLIYRCNYESSLLLNGLKTCSTDLFELSEIDNKNMYLELLDNFGGRIKADGLDNFYDLMIDPMTKDSLEFYKFPTDYISVLLYANALLADNKFFKHTNTASRRLRRYMLIAVYTYKVLSDAYALYANMTKHAGVPTFNIKQSAVIDKFLTDTITSDDSCINALQFVETTNSITTKGPSGMNSDRAYSLDKRTYDESMLNLLGMSTGFAANVGITRQSTINANIDDEGYVKSIDGDTSKMNVANSLTMTEALIPFGTTHDDPIRTAMTFIQTAKHAVRTEDSDPLLVTNGSDEALPYLTSDKFAFKAKKDGIIEELTDNYIIIKYDDGTKDYVNLSETIEKNSDGGYYVPLKLDLVEGLKQGSKVSPNQIVAFDKYSFSNSVGESDNIAYNVGKLTKVAIINSDEGFEDSGVITENLAQKLATHVDYQYDATLDKNTNLLYMAKVGDHVECGDNLMVWQMPFEDEGANSLMKTLSNDDISELGKRTLKSEVTGTVKGIKIFRTIELEDMSESLRIVVDEYEKPLRELYNKLKDNNLDISQVPAHYILPPTGKLKKAQNAVLIEFYVEYRDTVGVGDKIVYFAANKAVEKAVLPLGKEPYTEFRPNEEISAFISQTSIDKRLVISSMLVGAIQKLMIELDRSVKDILEIPYDDSKV